jgi:excisionase family DNA binding protein
MSTGEDINMTSTEPSLNSEAARQAIVPPPYLTTAEAAAYLRWSTRTIRQKIRDGAFIRGTHYFRPPGSQLRWRWESLARWLESEGAR